jgi:hypothetical protein
MQVAKDKYKCRKTQGTTKTSEKSMVKKGYSPNKVPYPKVNFIVK